MQIGRNPNFGGSVNKAQQQKTGWNGINQKMQETEKKVAEQVQSILKTQKTKRKTTKETAIVKKQSSSKKQEPKTEMTLNQEIDSIQKEIDKYKQQISLLKEAYK